MTEPSQHSVHETVRAHYAQAVLQVLDQNSMASCCGDTGGCGCGDACCTASADETEAFALYSDKERAELPDAAVLASMGCANPIAVAELREGERVLDLGSGGGIDVLLSARRVGPTGRAFGLDMTDEMLALAQRNAAEAGAQNVEFLKGMIEDVPLPAASVDVVISKYESGLRAAGLTDIVITPTHSVVAGMYSAIVRATKPLAT